MNQRIGSSPLLPSGTSTKRLTDARRRTRSEDDGDLRKYAPPHRAQANYIPSPEVLKNMIDRAREALSRGVYWDRGSILDLTL